VLVLVGEQHLVDEAVRQETVARIELDLAQHLEGAPAHLLEIGANLLGLEDGELAADLPRLLDRVVEVAELTAQRLASPDPPYQPELLEVGDVAEVPDQRAEDRRVDAVQLLIGERLDQQEGVTPCLSEPLGECVLALRLVETGPVLLGCRELLGDCESLPSEGGGLGHSRMLARLMRFAG
jgi:hypothetical protein